MFLKKVKLLLFLATTIIVLGLTFFLFKEQCSVTIKNYKYSIGICLTGFACFLAFYKSLNSAKKYYILYTLIAISFFLFLGIGLSKIKLESDKVVMVSVEVKLLHDDELQLFYLPSKEKIESEMYSITKKVQAYEHKKTVLFALADSLQVKSFRLDLGKDSTLQKAEINKITVTYNDETLQLFNPANKISYFHNNEYVKNKNQEFTLTPLNGQYDPFMFSDNIDTLYTQLLQNQKHLPAPFIISFILVFSLLIYLLLYAKAVSFKSSFFSFASCAFIFMLLLPSLNEAFQFYKDENQEKRSFAEKPILDLKNLSDYPKQYETYYNDHFGFRSCLTDLSGKIKYHLFNVSPIPSKAAIGKDGWMFLNGTFYEITQDLTKSNLYSTNQLIEKAKEWEERKANLEKDSILFYKAIWPDKYYIYPEFLPFTMKVLMKDTISRCDQVIRYLSQTNSTVSIIDIREILLKEKKDHVLYLKHDSHWNSYGGFFAYQELLKQMSLKNPLLKPHSIKDYHVSWNVHTGGDLTGMMSLKLSELKPSFVLKGDSSQVVELPVSDYPTNSLILENKKADTDLTLLIFRDSFTNAIYPFLTPHFKKIVLIWDATYSRELVNKVKPDIVLECNVTRYFR